MLAQKIWDYHLLRHKLKKADVILALGSNDLRVADYAAELFLAGWAPLLVFSGKKGELTKHWKGSEARAFARRAIAAGVPKEKILLEERSVNTGENIAFTKKLLAEHGIHPKRIILVQKPYMERRAHATFKKRCPRTKVVVTSPPIPFAKYPTKELPKELVIDLMVDDLQKIKIYPKKGFQIAQKIPRDVWDAYEKLVALGFSKHLIAE